MSKFYCRICNDGTLPCPVCSATGKKLRCERCTGKGKIFCGFCNGTGLVDE